MNPRRALIMLVLVLLPVWCGALEPPPLTGRVNDRAGLLSPATVERLERALADFEREQSTQIVVLTIPSLEGDDLEQFSIRVADAWKIGQQGKDNGVILILTKAERRVRIEVGMGLQGVLTDLTSGRIIRDVMRPFLKTGDFDRGITAGVGAIMAATRGEFSAEPARQSRQHQKGSSPAATVLLIAGVAAVVLGSFSRILAALSGAVGLPLAAFLVFPGLGLVILLILGGLGMIAGLLISALFGRGGGGGGFYWGGGGFGGGFGGGGGFSGGGGGFDGGGASDGW